MTRPAAPLPSPSTAAQSALAQPLGRLAPAVLAVAVPTLLAFNLPPSATFLNQAAALVGWGGWLLLLSSALPATWGRPLGDGLAALLAALGLLAGAALVSPLWAGLPATLSLSAAGLAAAGMLVVLTAAQLRRHGHGGSAFEAFCLALVVAGVLNAVIAVVQIYMPAWTGNGWLSAANMNRAGGNLRQANHLSSLLLWSLVAAVWLGEGRRWSRPWVTGLSLLMLFGIVLSGSRTGMLGTLMLAGWGVVDRRLSPASRRMLWLAPVAYAAMWGGMALWAQAQQQVFDGVARLQQADLSSNRLAIWSNTLSLIAAHPWLGVGFGEFNFAWTLTPFPGRPVEFFDHAHNLVLHLAVELGLPLATVVLSLLLWALVEAIRAARSATGDTALQLRAALMMVLLVALHSQLEYPLWYAYFLLPAAFAFGLCLGGTPAPPADVTVATTATGAALANKRKTVARAKQVVPQTPPPGRQATRPLLIGALLLTIAGAASVWDYMRVVVIFAQTENTPLAQRVMEGRRSWFFAHHADYAAATVVEHPSQVMVAFVRAPHYLLDTRLMIAWATALHEVGEEDRARHLAQRLREFQNPNAKEFFAPCEQAGAAPESLPFQCQQPQRVLGYLDFR
jgi:O-antigen ligase